MNPPSGPRQQQQQQKQKTLRIQKHENTLEFHSRLIEAAEVRFFDTYGATSSVSAAVFAADDWKGVPQRLKPSSVRARCGTAEPVPFVTSLFPIGLKPSLPESVWHGLKRSSVTVLCGTA